MQCKIRHAEITRRYTTFTKLLQKYTNLLKFKIHSWKKTEISKSIQRDFIFTKTVCQQTDAVIQTFNGQRSLSVKYNLKALRFQKSYRAEILKRFAL